jgi:hypothetical protein
LGIDADDLAVLCLCRAPLPENWDAVLEAISGRFGLDRARLEGALTRANQRARIRRKRGRKGFALPAGNGWALAAQEAPEAGLRPLGDRPGAGQQFAAQADGLPLALNRFDSFPDEVV